MKLIIAIVQDRDTNILRDTLIKEGFKTTVICGKGGFLRETNTTFLIGVESEQVDKIIEIIKNNCHQREHIITTEPPELSPIGLTSISYPTKIVVGGATVFILDVEKINI